MSEVPRTAAGLSPLRKALQDHGWYMAGVVEAEWIESSEWEPVLRAAIEAEAAGSRVPEGEGLREAMALMDEEWPKFTSSEFPPPEDSRDVPWPVRNFVRRARAALAVQRVLDEEAAR